MTGAEPSRLGRSAAQTRAVVISKLIEYAGLALFTILLPRSMGPEGFGTFAAVLALVGLLTASTGLGAFTTFGRFVPEYLETGDRVAISRLYSQLLAVRVAMCIPLGVGLTAAILVMLPDLGLDVAVLAAGSFMIGATGETGFQLQFGLNRLGYSLARSAWSRLLIVGGILALDGASPRTAVLCLFLSELALGFLALWWSRSYFDTHYLKASIRDVREALRFGSAFFGASLLLMGIWRGGELTVTALSTNRSEIAFYSIASAIVMAGSSLLGQVTALLLPSMTRLHLRGEEKRFVAWMATSLRYVTVLAGLGAISVFSLADVVIPVVLGPGFERVALNLKILAVGMIPLGVVRAATSLAIVQKASRQAVFIGLEGFVVFLVLNLALVPRLGSLGASVAVSAAFVVAGARALYRMGLQRVAADARLGWAVLATSGIVLFLVPGIAHVVASLASIGCFLGVVAGFRLVRTADIRDGLGRLLGS